MKVHYKKSIKDQIHVAMLEARKLNKKVDYIELNQEEWDEMVFCDSFASNLFIVTADWGEVFYNGVKLKLGKEI